MAYRAASVKTAGDGTGTTLVINRPAGAATDDILWLRLYVEDTTLTPSLSPGSWTKITAASGEQLADATDFEVHSYWSRQGAESGDITVSWGGASVWRTGIAAAFTGRLTAGDPLDGTSTFNPVGAATTTLTCLAVTTGNANADIIASGGAAAGGTYAWSVLAEIADIGVQTAAWVTQAAAGGSGNKTATCTSSLWAGELACFREATAGLTAAQEIGIFDQQLSGQFVGVMWK